MKLSHYQVFPITFNTFQGVASAQPLGFHRLVRATADGDITFTFPNGVTKVVAAKETDDYVADLDCVSVSSVSAVIMS